MSLAIVHPPGWPRPRGYSNGVIASGRRLYIAGQVGWEVDGRFSGDFVRQFARALDNILEVVRTGGGKPEDVATMTVFVTDLDEYKRSARALGAIWRERFGTHYPAMALVQVVGLVEPGSLLEIQAEAALEDGP